ncbi:MAG: hypothetical protein H7Y89_03630 [Steroidobacteraceae bacterium]|nr:hypothetical protein [Steroidobacteraceae bacterium]
MGRQFKASGLVLLGVVLLLVAGQFAQAQSPPTPNMVVEVVNADVSRLEVRLSGGEFKESLQYEFKGVNGTITGGIALPKEGRLDWEIVAYDREGKLTHEGKGSIGGLVHTERAIDLPLESIDGGEGLVVSLAHQRIVLEVESYETSETLSVRAQVFDPQGNRADIKPGDLTWQLTDGRLIDLIKHEKEYKYELVPKKDAQIFELCTQAPQVFVCTKNGFCKPLRVCSDPFVSISAGGRHTCAIAKSGALFCWGDNQQGQLGAPTASTCGTSAPACHTRALPVVCPPGSPCKFTQVSAGETLTAAVDVNGNVWWWGRGSTVHHRVNATLAAGPVSFYQAAAGYGHACAISGGRNEIWCWGLNDHGAAGAPWIMNEVPDSAPVRVMAPGKFRQIAAGGQHTCAIGAGGSDVICWGHNDWGMVRGPSSTQLPGTGIGPFFAQQFGGLVSITDVATSVSSTCVAVSGNVKCWGENSYLTTSGFGAVENLAVGKDQVCATTNQQARCMGANNWGQLGVGTTHFQAAPANVLAPPPLYTDLSAGDNHTCGITPEGDAFCWGNNYSGQLGNGSFSFAAVKVPNKVLLP